MQNFPILLMTILLPIFSAIYMALFVRQSMSQTKILFTKYIAILSSSLTLISAIFLIIDFDSNLQNYQHIEHYDFLPSIGLDIDLGVDGISIFFVLLTAILTVICISISMFSVSKNIKEFLICFLVLEGLAIGVFCSMNLLLFYIFFEAILIPMYMIIGMWGGENRIYATIKFFLYTLFGSVLFLLVIIYLFIEFGTLSIPVLAQIVPSLPNEIQYYLWFAAFIAFAVKVPMFPLHTWLPDAHVEAPTAGSVILAGILLKVGAYGFLRILLPMFPFASHYFADFVMILSLVAIIYASLVAIAQTNMKKTIAYSSIAHMGFVTAGIFSFTAEGISGALMQMLSHGITSSALFIVVGILYDRMHTKEIFDFGGVASKMPKLATLFMIFVLSSVGLPGTSGFIGEFYSLIGIYQFKWYYAIFAASSMVLGAIYMLRLYRNVMLGEVKNLHVQGLNDLSGREVFCLLPLAVLIILIGIFPSIITNFYMKDIEAIIEMTRILS